MSSDTGAAEEIRRLSREQVEAYVRGDAVRFMETIAPDRVVMNPNQPARVDNKNLEELQAFLDSVEQTAEVEIDEVVVEGDWAFEWGHGRGTLSPHSAAGQIDPTISYRYKYLRLWNRTNGQWKNCRMIWNSEDIESGGVHSVLI